MFSRFFTGGGKKQASTNAKRSATGRSFAAVEVIPQEAACCEAVQGLSGERFLAENAPLFPLPECDREQCNCRYRRYQTRRTDTRRDADLGLDSATEIYRQTGKCRRSGARGRRATDKIQ